MKSDVNTCTISADGTCDAPIEASFACAQRMSVQFFLLIFIQKRTDGLPLVVATGKSRCSILSHNFSTLQSQVWSLERQLGGGVYDGPNDGSDTEPIFEPIGTAQPVMQVCVLNILLEL